VDFHISGMSAQQYSVIGGAKALDGGETANQSHFQFQLGLDDEQFVEVDFNIKSNISYHKSTAVLFHHAVVSDDDFVETLEKIPSGVHTPQLNLDFKSLLTKDDWAKMSPTAPKDVATALSQAINSQVKVFGSRYFDLNHNQLLDFNPQYGIHDIHMHVIGGYHQDGALFSFTDSQKYEGYYVAFQSDVARDESLRNIVNIGIGSIEDDSRAHVTSAVVNPLLNAPQHLNVSNPTHENLDLDGWNVTDDDNNVIANLSGTIPSGEESTFETTSPITKNTRSLHLNNKNGHWNTSKFPEDHQRHERHYRPGISHFFF